MYSAHSPSFQSLHLRHSSLPNASITLPTAQLILQPFRRFTYATAHSPTLPSLHLCHSSFSNPSIASPMPQLIPQPFFCFSYVTSSSLTSPGEPPMMYLRKSSGSPLNSLLEWVSLQQPGFRPFILIDKSNLLSMSSILLCCLFLIIL